MLNPTESSPTPEPTSKGSKKAAPETGPTVEEELAAAKADVEKWKALSRQNEERSKANADAAAKLQEIEDANKSELQKLTDRANEATRRAEEAERRATEADLKALRLSVAASKGLTPSQAARLIGSDEETLSKDADDLLASFAGAGEGKRPSPTRPVPRLRGGDTPEDEPDETDPLALVAKIPRR